MLDAFARICRELLDRSAPIQYTLASAAMVDAEAADIIYTLMSPETHRTLTVERGWNADRYQQWLATALRALLL